MQSNLTNLLGQIRAFLLCPISKLLFFLIKLDLSLLNRRIYFSRHLQIIKNLLENLFDILALKCLLNSAHDLHHLLNLLSHLWVFKLKIRLLLCHFIELFLILWLLSLPLDFLRSRLFKLNQNLLLLFAQIVKLGLNTLIGFMYAFFSFVRLFLFKFCWLQLCFQCVNFCIQKVFFISTYSLYLQQFLVFLFKLVQFRLEVLILIFIFSLLHLQVHYELSQLAQLVWHPFQILQFTLNSNLLLLLLQFTVN